MSNILITGGLGYIGSHTALDLLINTNDNIVIADNCCNSDFLILNKIKKISQKKVSFYNVNIGDYKSMLKIFKTEKIDSVIHFAALKSVSDSIKQPFFYYENNITALMTLLNVARQCDVNKFIFSSSATVYSSMNKFPVDEQGILGYINPYAQTKLIGEDILLREHQQSGMNIGILRYFNPLGNESSGQLGDRLTLTSTNLMPMLYRALQQKKSFFVFGNDYPTPDKSAVRDYIHVKDLASAHRSMLNHLNKYNGKYIFNVGLGKGISVLDLVNTFINVNKVNISIKYQDPRAGDLPICFANAKKIKTQLCWKPVHDLDDMCRDAYVFFKNHYQ
jgi:UDP-glucose 4-epimerase